MLRIAEARKAKGLTQKELAFLIKTAQNTVSQWENAKRDIPTDKLKKLADIFEVSTDWLLGRTEAA